MHKFKQTGITLIELMIALILALLVTATILTIFISNVKSSAENIQMMQLNQELRAAMNFMSDEIKRHGYSSASTSTAMNSLSPTSGTANCISYAYTASGAAVTVRGFRLNAGALEWSDQNTSCAGAGNWQDITSGDTTVTAFTVGAANSASAGSGTLAIRRFDITLTGQRQLNPGTATRTVQETIRVRNEDP
jgi:type II secretory pathway component PulJ